MSGFDTYADHYEKAHPRDVQTDSRWSCVDEMEKMGWTAKNKGKCDPVHCLTEMLWEGVDARLQLVQF